VRLKELMVLKFKPPPVPPENDPVWNNSWSDMVRHRMGGTNDFLVQ